MSNALVFLGGAILALALAVGLRAALTANRNSPDNIRRSVFAYTQAQINKARIGWLEAEPEIVEAMAEDAILVATRGGRTDMVIADEHVQRLVRLAERAGAGFQEGSLENRLWRRVLERADERRGNDRPADPRSPPR